MPTENFFNRDIVSIKDFSRQDLEFIFNCTDRVSALGQNEKTELGKGRTLGYIFYEPSTRTRMSFEAAMASLGEALSEFLIRNPHRLKKAKALLILSE